MTNGLIDAMEHVTQYRFPIVGRKKSQISNRWKTQLAAILIVGAALVGHAEVIFNESGRTGSIPADWTAHQVVATTAADGYLHFTNTASWLATPSLDLSAYTNVQLSFDVAKYGTGDDGPLTVQISTNAGASWNAQVFDSPIPTSATYSNSGPTEITALSSNTVIRWTSENSPSGKRLRDVLLTGTGPEQEPEPVPWARFQGFEGTEKDTWTYQTVPGSGSIVVTNRALDQTDDFSLSLIGSETGAANPYVLFDNVDLIGLSNVVFSIGYAARGVDNNDDLYVDLSYDNGVTWPDSVKLMNGFGNFNLNFGVTDADRSVDANPYTQPITNDQVRVRVRFDEATGPDNRYDYYFIDDVMLWAEGEQPTLAFAKTDSRATEGDADVRIAVTISEAANATVNVRMEGTATLDQDYTITSTSLVFTVGGSTTQELELAIMDDGISEGPEYVRFTLERAEGAGIAGPAHHTLLIRDNQSVSIMAANLPSGDPGTTYGPAGKRMIRALNPDVVAIQEWLIDVGETFDQFVEEQFGESFEWFRGSGTKPTGIISRWPILTATNWPDTSIGDRDYSVASIDLPGPNNLHVISVHFKAGSSGNDRDQRIEQARALTNYIAEAGFPENDYVVIAGDLNVQSRTEDTMTILGNVVTDSIQPADQNGVPQTNIPRNQHYDYVLPDPALNGLHIPLEYGAFTFSNGIVFDTRVWEEHPLPARIGDTADPEQQHLAVMKVFALELGDPLADTDGDGIPDWWEELYFGGPTNAVATAWAANQVNTVLQAYIADLDPTNSNAVLVVEWALHDEDAQQFRFMATSTGRVYDVYWRTNLSDLAAWEAMNFNTWGTGEDLVVGMTNAMPGNYYWRGAVRLPDGQGE